MITTPLGQINIYTDGSCLEYKEISHCYDRPPVKGHPIAGCYRIHGSVPEVVFGSHGSRTTKEKAMFAHGLLLIRLWTENKNPKGAIALKKRKWLIAVAILLVLAIIGISKLLPSYSSTLEANWGISLPWKARLTEVYEKDSGASFHGDGVRYHVFSYKYEDYIDLMFAWPPTEYPTNYYATTSEAAEAWLDEIDVPAEDRPDYANCTSWHKSQKDNSEIIFFWDDDLNRLYIVENFI